MSTELKLADILFGKNSSKARELFAGKNLKPKDFTKGQAQEMLGLIEHPEIREVLGDLETQISEGKKNVFYSTSEARTNQYLSEDDSSKIILFTDWSYNSGFLNLFSRLIEKTFPEYKLTETNYVLTLRFERV